MAGTIHVSDKGNWQENGRKIYVVMYQSLLKYFMADDESYPH